MPFGVLSKKHAGLPLRYKDINICIDWISSVPFGVLSEKHLVPPLGQSVCLDLVSSTYLYRMGVQCVIKCAF